MDLFDVDLGYESEQLVPTPRMPTMLALVAPEIVVVGDSTLRNASRPGGAAGIAVSLVSLGARVELLSVCGNDRDGTTAQTTDQPRRGRLRARGGGRPPHPVRCRAAALSALSCVDHVTITDDEVPVGLLDRLCPDRYLRV